MRAGAGVRVGWMWAYGSVHMSVRKSVRMRTHVHVHVLVRTCMCVVVCLVEECQHLVARCSCGLSIMTCHGSHQVDARTVRQQAKPLQHLYVCVCRLVGCAGWVGG